MSDRVMAWWSFREDGEKESKPKTVSVLMGYFFLVNYCIGTGFLGIPYSFFYSGYLAAIPTLLAMALSAWVTAKWLLEVMARAQVCVDQSISVGRLLYEQYKPLGASPNYFFSKITSL